MNLVAFVSFVFPCMCVFVCVYLFNTSLDIDQLTRIMALVGTPDDELLAKINSEEVMFSFS